MKMSKLQLVAAQYRLALRNHASAPTDPAKAPHAAAALEIAGRMFALAKASTGQELHAHLIASRPIDVVRAELALTSLGTVPAQTASDAAAVLARLAAIDALMSATT